MKISHTQPNPTACVCACACAASCACVCVCVCVCACACVCVVRWLGVTRGRGLRAATTLHGAEGRVRGGSGQEVVIEYHPQGGIGGTPDLTIRLTDRTGSVG